MLSFAFCSNGYLLERLGSHSRLAAREGRAMQLLPSVGNLRHWNFLKRSEFIRL